MTRVSIPRPQTWHRDGSPTEIESREELKDYLTAGTLSGLTIQGLRLDVNPPDLTGVDVRDALFVGCRFPDAGYAADLVRRGASVVPIFEETPYPTTPSRLYVPDDLAAGFDQGGYESIYDTVVYQHFLAHGGALPDVREALAQRIHERARCATLRQRPTPARATHPSFAFHVLELRVDHLVKGNQQLEVEE